MFLSLNELPCYFKTKNKQIKNKQTKNKKNWTKLKQSLIIKQLWLFIPILKTKFTFSFYFFWLYPQLTFLIFLQSLITLFVFFFITKINIMSISVIWEFVSICIAFTTLWSAYVFLKKKHIIKNKINNFFIVNLAFYSFTGLVIFFFYKENIFDSKCCGDLPRLIPIMYFSLKYLSVGIAWLKSPVYLINKNEIIVLLSWVQYIILPFLILKSNLFYIKSGQIILVLLLSSLPVVFLPSFGISTKKLIAITTTTSCFLNSLMLLVL